MRWRRNADSRVKHQFRQFSATFRNPLQAHRIRASSPRLRWPFQPRNGPRKVLKRRPSRIPVKYLYIVTEVRPGLHSARHDGRWRSHAGPVPRRHHAVVPSSGSSFPRHWCRSNCSQQRKDAPRQFANGFVRGSLLAGLRANRLERYWAWSPGSVACAALAWSRDGKARGRLRSTRAAQRTASGPSGSDQPHASAKENWLRPLGSAATVTGASRRSVATAVRCSWRRSSTRRFRAVAVVFRASLLPSTRAVRAAVQRPAAAAPTSGSIGRRRRSPRPCRFLPCGVSSSSGAASVVPTRPRPSSRVPYAAFRAGPSCQVRQPGLRRGHFFDPEGRSGSFPTGPDSGGYH